ncbi:hypothetical protein M9Y10_035256 [Tritrichomonas musculus]|uniref:HNH nuclease domain-containing protein n=1 Tax=Tritrichomonas musculus TaxID=1915356 RepID=A0ABR2KKG5_9EUKA
MSVQEQSNWEILKVDNDYEICTEYPYQIRRRSNGYIISEFEHQRSKYIQVKLNGKLHYKHKIIALQWIENDDPENKVEVEHRNRIRADYHIDNLCWKTRSMNDLNRTGWGKYKFEYVDELPIDVIPIILYKNWEFEGYFMDQNGDVWFDNSEQYRKIRVSKENKVRLWDINHVNHNIGIKGLRREIL